MLLHFAVNWLAVIVATVASMALGFGWYTVLRQPMARRASARPRTRSSGGSDALRLVGLVQLVMAYFIALLTPKLFGATNVTNGTLVAFLMWLGFVITSMIQSHRYGGQPSGA